MVIDPEIIFFNRRINLAGISLSGTFREDLVSEQVFRTGHANTDEVAFSGLVYSTQKPKLKKLHN